MAARYDAIGRTYTATRGTDPRIAARIWDALGDARTVVNVGAGTGSYEPPDRDVTAVEPSAVMIAQRPPGAAPAVQASAEGLARLRADLESGAWARRHADLLERDELDLGYRLLVGRQARAPVGY